MARFLFLSTLVGLLTASAGCRQQDEIRRYTVPKQSEIDRLAGGGGEAAETSELSGAQRMLAAIVLRPTQGWFFKFFGPQAAIDTHADDFDGFLKTVHFKDDATPEWSLPEGWTQKPGDQFRYATLAINAAPLEVTVSTLGRGDADETEYVLRNINRWRGQVGLENIAPSELQRETKQVELLDGETAIVVDLVGQASSGAMAGPFAGGRGTAAPPPASPGGASPQLKYEVPDGWQEVPATRFRKASFRISDGGQSGDVSVTDLDASAGDLLPNVNRWREQVGLGPTTQLDVDRHVSSVDVGPEAARHEGQYIEMIGDEKATLAVIVKAAGRAWFIKLTGDKLLVERQRDHFKSFVQSLAIGETTGANDGN
ncbi:MAG TPA: hypothetical protein VFI31_28230 [Pirellulales bacterium]|nr:hypothetical protein [Pirellulales bacterium]